jgi:SAM-dependent methyltransferase
MTDNDVVEQIRDRYAAAARAAMGTGRRTLDVLDDLDGGGSGCCGGDSCCTGAAATDVDVFGSALYDTDQAGQVPQEAVTASLGCGNPTAVADLNPGERVLDLGSGGGLDVLLSARRVGPSGFAYGVDMTDEMLELARGNAAKAGATNVEFLKGRIERVPLPDGAVDVVISNCVINLSVDKPAVLAEMFRVLAPGGRVGVSDVVAEDHLSVADREERGSHVGCVAGALSRQEYVDGLTAAGFTGIEVRFTHEVAPQVHGAIVRAVKPA